MTHHDALYSVLSRTFQNENLVFLCQNVTNNKAGCIHTCLHSLPHVSAS